MTRKKQQGGYLKGNPHSRGGISAVVAGKEPVELEGEEYIMSAEATRRIGKENLDEWNFGKKMPMGGRVSGRNIPSSSRSLPRNIIYREHGGEISVSNDEASVGDIHTTRSHSGYKVGE